MKKASSNDQQKAPDRPDDPLKLKPAAVRHFKPRELIAAFTLDNWYKFLAFLVALLGASFWAGAWFQEWREQTSSQEQQAELRAVRDLNSRLESQNSNLLEQNERYRKTQVSFEQDAGKLADELQVAIQELGEKNKEAANQLQTIGALKKDLVLLRRQLSAVESRAESAIIESTNLSKLKKELQQAEARNEASSSKIVELEKQLNAIQRELKSKQTESRCKGWDTERESLLAQRSKLNEEIETALMWSGHGGTDRKEAAAYVSLAKNHELELARVQKRLETIDRMRDKCLSG
ncbi:MAG: hypothetical protein AB2820_17595 [Candidatus Thiodiazotropha sp.]